MGEDGFEPSKRNAADLQSVPFGHSGTPPYSVKICRTEQSYYNTEFEIVKDFFDFFEKTAGLNRRGRCPHRPSRKLPRFSAISGKYVTFAVGPMWASAPTAIFFDTRTAGLLGDRQKGNRNYSSTSIFAMTEAQRGQRPSSLAASECIQQRGHLAPLASETPMVRAGKLLP